MASGDEVLHNEGFRARWLHVKTRRAGAQHAMHESVWRFFISIDRERWLSLFSSALL